MRALSSDFKNMLKQEQDRVKSIKDINIKFINNGFSTLESKYKKVLNYLSYCRMYEIFAIDSNLNYPSGDKDSDDNVLLHVAGDVFGEGTGLEGSRISLSMLNARISIIESMIKALTTGYISVDSTYKGSKLLSTDKIKRNTPAVDPSIAYLKTEKEKSHIAIELSIALETSKNMFKDS